MLTYSSQTLCIIYPLGINNLSKHIISTNSSKKEKKKGPKTLIVSIQQNISICGFGKTFSMVLNSNYETNDILGFKL